MALNINNFPLLDENIDITNVHTIRDELYKPITSWKDKMPEKIDLTDIPLNLPERFTIIHDNVPFECLYLSDSSKKLTISLGGGGRRNKKYPTFFRWKYKNFIKQNIICIDDPMYFYNTDVNCVMWYYGTKKCSFLHLLAEIVQKIMKQFSLSSRDITFLGSSGGGYAAIYLANIISGSTAIALNPQYEIAKWNPKITKLFKDKFDIDITSETDIFDRNILHITNQQSLFFLVENLFSDIDFDKQFIPFCSRHNIMPQYGIHQFGNIITWVHASKGMELHSTNPERIGIKILHFLKDEYWKGRSINEFNKFSVILNEALNDKWTYLKELHEYKQNKNLATEALPIFMDSLANFTMKTNKLLFKKIVRKANNIRIYILDNDNFFYDLLFLDGRTHIRLVTAKNTEENIKILDDIQFDGCIFAKKENKSYIRYEFTSQNFLEKIQLFINNTINKLDHKQV